MKLRIITLLLIATIYFPSCTDTKPKTEKAEVKEIYELLEPKAFQARLASEPGIILDVRTPSEQKNGMIKGAQALDIFAENFEMQIDKLDKSKTYYVYCAAGGRSLEACEIMEKKGFTKVIDLDGGIGRWRDEGLEVMLP
ncbi:MAG: rhodanese-like domain-containing protein [Bacteroidia bacterium]|nr:rhodanese-like domain-containing protein [Bacteroidia bacterium]MCF8426072.1 rhodanese-like domain-containing protein [Bacteroidia bacterium]MCF8446359.1 rhodanese-like domain-containing protein [Bacteroidia bacterium]